MTKALSFPFSGFLNIDPLTMAYSLNSTAQEHLTAFGTCSENAGELGVGRGSWQSASELVLQRHFPNEEMTRTISDRSLTPSGSSFWSYPPSRVPRSLAPHLIGGRGVSC